MTFVALAGGMSAALLATGNAYGVTGCRGDPLVSLSNGLNVRLVANISLDASQVSNVAYVLHVPQGLTVTSVQFDNGPVPETFNWVADQPAVGANGNAQFTYQAIVAGSAPGQASIYATATNGAVEFGTQQNGNVGQKISQNFQYQPNSNSTCYGDGTLTGVASQSLTVPSGVTCTVENLSVGGSVQIQPGGTLNATNLTVNQGVVVQSQPLAPTPGAPPGAQPTFNSGVLDASGLQVGQDLQTQTGSQVSLNNATIQGSASLQGLTGSDQLCGMSVGQNLTIQNSSSTSTVVLGNPSAGCAGDVVDGNAQLQNDTGTIVASGDTVEKQLQCNQANNFIASNDQIYQASPPKSSCS